MRTIQRCPCTVDLSSLVPSGRKSSAMMYRRKQNPGHRSVLRRSDCHFLRKQFLGLYQARACGSGTGGNDSTAGPWECHYHDRSRYRGVKAWQELSAKCEGISRNLREGIKCPPVFYGRVWRQLDSFQRPSAQWLSGTPGAGSVLPFALTN